ncbi:MFS general substrate transporter [Hysterangium stoloniferum]|nr:MFS general substrate transporter [Hysterangium stoloniferum]
MDVPANPEGEIPIPATSSELSSKGEGNVIYVSWDGPNDPENPVNWSRTRKWVLTGLGGAFLTMVGGSVAAYAISQPSLQKALNISDSTATLGIVAFTVSFGLAPLLLAPFSELFGRSPVYIASVVVFWLMFLPQALAQNFTTVFVTRFIAGIGGSTSVSIVGGILADIWETHERGLPMAIFSFVAFAGTGLGPVSLGYVELALGFRFVNWILFGASGLVALAIIAVTKETRASVILTKKAKHLRAQTGDMRYCFRMEEDVSSIGKKISISLTRPLRMLFTEPVLFSSCIWITYAWGILYLMLESIPLVFTQLYNFNSGESGLVFMGQIIGPLLGMIGNIWCDRAYHRHVSRKGPEARLYIAMCSGIALPIVADEGCWMYEYSAWTSSSNITWIAPVISICVTYAAMFGIYTACFNYITDSYSIYSSSAMSGQTAVRVTLGALFSLSAQPMYNRLGIHLAGTILAALSTAFAVTPFILYRYGSALRARSKFAKRLASLDEEERLQTA